MTVQEAIKQIENLFYGIVQRAIEKQIPRKPYSETNGYRCPNCCTEFDWDTKVKLKDNVYQYCPHCGQAIDKF